MIDENKQRLPPTSNAGGDSKTPPPAFTIFRAVIQADFKRQLEVLEWLNNDPMYQVVYIAHNQDLYDFDDEHDRALFGVAENAPEAVWRKAEYKRTRGYKAMDGSDLVDVYHFGDIKPLHYHLIVRVPKKCVEATMFKRFGGYVRFDGVHDVFACASYLTHSTFEARNKHRYADDEVQGDKALYEQWRGYNGDSDAMSILERWQTYVAINHGDKSAALSAAIGDGDRNLVAQLMRHGFVFKNFF